MFLAENIVNICILYKSSLFGHENTANQQGETICTGHQADSPHLKMRNGVALNDKS